MPIKLKFKKIFYDKAMPNGYRLATVEEVRNNLDTIKGRALVEKDESKAYLLDGCRLFDYRLYHGFQYCTWSLVVKEKEWDENANIWKKKWSACYPSNGNFLRKHVYEGIILSQKGRYTAMALATINADAEVIYWVLKTTNQLEVQRFTDLLKSSEMRGYTNVRVNFWENVFKDLSASEFPLQFPLEQDHFMNSLTIRLIDIELSYIFMPYDNKILGIAFTDLLIEVYSINIVHYKARDGMSLLDRVTDEAINRKKFIPALTKLLSVSHHSVENQVSKIEDIFGDILIEAIERGYAQLVEDLLKLKDCVEQLTTDVSLENATMVVDRFGNLLEKHVGNERQREKYLQCLTHLLNLLKQKVGNELQLDNKGKTLFHYAADSGNESVFLLLVEAYSAEYREKKRDKWGRNFLHWAALNGQVDFCKLCVDEWQLKVDAKDSFGRNSVHLATQGKKGHLVVNYLVDSSSVKLIYARDDEGRTPLHLASAKGNIRMVDKLLSFCADNPSKLKNYIQQVDGFGRTALQMAAGGGHTRIVRLFLDKGSDPLTQRDVNGSTALHYATQVKDAEVAVAISQSLLNKYRNGSNEKSLLLWASAVGIGTAEQIENIDPLVEDFLLREKARDNIILLKAAAETNNAEMAWELLNRGADIADLTIEEKRNFEIEIKEIERANKQGQDKPSLEDNLERKPFAEGLAALFLNRFIESPITVGISGEWGIGKSSLMIQSEKILLMAASKSSFPNLLRSENFPGAKGVSLSTNGRKIYTRIRNSMDKFLAFSKTGNGLVKLLEDYHPQHHAIYKSLACMDLHNQMLSSNVNRDDQFQQMREVLRILTIRHNAWHYRDEHEAWAGLAVTITKEIEQAMTRAQWFSTCWRYSWAKNSVNICVQIFLPCLLVTFLAGWVAWAAWTLLRDVKFKDLKYGSIPCTIIAIAWVVLKSVISVVKPVSTQMMGYINSPDHTARLGYQEQVISDINFLKRKLGRKPHWFFSFISGGWCRNWFGLYPDNVENTCVPKFRPASEDQLRMITFVDDLDRCDEKVVIKDTNHL